MKLWHISQDKKNGYDTYDSAVVAAETEREASVTHPSGSDSEIVWDDETLDWCYGLGGHVAQYHAWCDPIHVKTRLLGEAVEGTKPGVICASFNAG